jgi:hypothetical protein
LVKLETIRGGDGEENVKGGPVPNRSELLKVGAGKLREALSTNLALN